MLRLLSHHYAVNASFGYAVILNLVYDMGSLRQHNAKEKITLEDLFLLHSMDGGDMVDVPWNLANFLSDKARGYKKSMIVEAHLIGSIARLDELMPPYSLRAVTLRPGTSLLNTVNEDEATTTEAKRAQDEACGVRRYPNMSFNNMLREMDERMSDMDTNIFKLSNGVEELTVVVSEMSEQYDPFYREFNTIREEQQRFYSWETDHFS
nr:hypothetical protein [Tanacetum cinerariifolium]